MAEMRGSAVVCDDKCGCPTPCPGGLACKCGAGETTGVSEEHKACSCGEHCGCNPCYCPKGANITSAGRAGKAFCRCGAGCTCVTCAT